MYKKNSIVVKCMIMILVALFLVSCTVTGKGDMDKAADGSKSGELESTKRDIIEVSIALWGLQDFGKDDLGKAIEEKIDIKINEVNLSWDNWGERITLMAATDELPDCVPTYTMVDANRFYNWIDQDVTRTIPESLLKDLPLTKKVFEDSLALQAIKKIRGEYFYIPRPESATNIHVAQQDVIYYRKDWAKNIGIEKEPETMEEYYQLLKAFAEKDPNKTGKRDTVGLTLAGGSDSAVTGFFAPYGINPLYWVEEEGQFIPGYMSRKNIEALKFIRKLLMEGILDPEFAKNGYKEAIGKFAKNTAGALMRQGDTGWLKSVMSEYYGEANPDKDPFEVIGIMGPLKKDASSDPAWPAFISTSGTEISSKVSDEKLRRILELNEYLLSSEGKDLMRWGFEGIDYKKDGETYISLLGENESLGTKYPSISLKSFSDWDFDYNALSPGNPGIPDEYKKLGDEVRAKYNPWARKERLDVTYLSTPAKDTLPISWIENYIGIVLMPATIEDGFELFLKDCMNKGADKAINEVNEAMKNR